MHRDLTAKRRELVGLAGGLERHDDADLAEAGRDDVVDVLADDALADLKLGRPTQRHVLADGGDGAADGLLDGATTG